MSERLADLGFDKPLGIVERAALDGGAKLARQALDGIRGLGPFCDTFKRFKTDHEDARVRAAAGVVIDRVKALCDDLRSFFAVANEVPSGGE